ncbi:ribosomal protein L10-domain-containing protein [Cladochytrium replicatum]|nr:ribosomal protein L10-domain-containing protein [Cladochytrium replicatum]
MSKGDGRVKKEAYFQKLQSYLEEYPTIFIVNVDNVGSNQMHQIRISLRGDSVVLMGKNTMVRKALRNLLGEHPEYEKLMSVVKGNVGFVFTKGDLKEIRTKVVSNRVRAPAKAGAIAPVDVIIPAGNTGMEPGKTSFFQALGIPTKIARGTIEIVNDVNILKVGQKVGQSESALLNMLNISPFTYGMTINCIYDGGAVFSESVLDIEEEQLLEAFKTGINTVAALSLALDYPTAASMPYAVQRALTKAPKDLASISLAIDYPTKASVPHSIINGYKRLLGVALVVDYTWEGLNLSSLSAPAAAAPVAAAPAAAAPAAKAAAAPKVEEKEESDDDMGFGLFD